VRIPLATSGNDAASNSGAGDHEGIAISISEFPTLRKVIACSTVNMRCDHALPVDIAAGCWWGVSTAAAR
jgi:hypothetical protein